MPSAAAKLTEKQRKSKRDNLLKRIDYHEGEDPNEIVDAGPFLRWLESTDRSGWTNRLSDTQQRYVERALKEQPDAANIHSIDSLFIKLDMPWLLHSLYPDA